MSGSGSGAIRAPDALDAPAHPVARWLSYACGLCVAFSLAHFLLGLPIQLSDSYGQMLKLSADWKDLLYGELTQHGYMRPLMWGDLKLVYDLSGGNYFLWYRGLHVVQVTLLVLAYLHLVRPRTLLDAAVVPLGLAVLISLHTFEGTIAEAFPINHFMTILLCCFAAASLALARHRWWNDVLGVVLFLVAAFTIESGLLVWVIFTGGWLVGMRGISKPGVVALTVLLAGYFYLRFGLLGVGSPGLIERSSGFGFRILDPVELVARFGSHPTWFYLYNVVASALSVLLSEPTGGVFALTDRTLRGELDLASLISPIASISATLLVALYVFRRRHAWLARQWTRDDHLVLLFIMVLAANAVISYPYTKDVVMSPAGAFFAVAVFIATRSFISTLPVRTSSRLAPVLVTALAIMSTTWAIRMGETYRNLRVVASVQRNEWAYAEESLAAEGIALGETERALFTKLREDALFTHPAPPPLVSPFARILGDD